MRKPGNGAGGDPPRREATSRRDRARLLARVGEEGDTRAAQRLVDLYSERLFGLAFRILGERQAAEDVVQDVFLCLLEGKAKYRGKGHPDAFLLRVTSFLAIDRAKAGFVRHRKELAAMERSPASSQPSPVLDRLLRKELEVEIGDLVVELPPETRAAIALRFWEGVTVREIARILSSTRSTVSRRIESALEKLRRPLIKRGFGATVVTSLLGDVLGGMEVVPPSPGFQAAVAKACASGGAAASVAALPTVPEAAGALSAAKLSMGAAAATAVVAAVYSLVVMLSPGVPPMEGEQIGDAEVADSAVLPGGGVAETIGGDESPLDRGGARGAVTRNVTIAGRVLGPDGRPARGAVVRLFEGGGHLPVDYAVVLAVTAGPVAQTTVDRRGAFAFRELKGESYRLFAMAPGTAPGTSGLLRVDRGEALPKITIRLAAGEVIEGVAQLESGEPAAGVRVRAFLPVLLGQLRAGFWLEEATSGEDGSFRVSGVGSVAAEMLVDSDRHTVVQAPKYARRGEELIEIVVAAGATVLGRVVDPDGAPAGGAEVLAFAGAPAGGSERSLTAPWLLTRRTVSDAAGNFTLRGLPDGDHVLFARRSDCALSERTTVEVSRDRSSLDRIELALRPGGRIDGRFVREGEPFGPAKAVAIPVAVDANGLRAPREAFFLLTRFAMEPATQRVDAVTFDVAEDGTFIVDGLAPEEYMLVAYQDSMQLLRALWSPHEGAGEETVEVPPRYRPGQRGVEVEAMLASDTLFLAGQVVDRSGAGIANAKIECSFLREGGPSGAISSATVAADQRGVFRMESMVPLGTCESLGLRARTPDGRVGLVERLSLSDGKEVQGLRIVIDAGPAIAGTLTSSAGDPIPDAVVKLEQDGHEPWPRAEERETKSDRSGHYRFGSVDKNRRYRVVVDADGWARATLGDLDVGTPDADLVLRPESVIRGRVVDLDGAPVELSGMSLSRYENARVSSFSWDVESEGEGRFVLKRLEAGEYSLSAYGKPSAGGRQPLSRQSERIAVAEGETIDGVVLTMTDLVALKGRVVDASTGAPVAGAVVADWDPEAHRFPRGRLRVTTGSDGRFRLEGFSRGNVRLHVVAEGYLKLEENVLVSGETDAVARLELIPARNVEVRVTDERGTPVESALVFSGFEWPKRAVTDRGGRASVVLPAVDPDSRRSRGDAWIEVQKEGYKPQRIEWKEGLPREQRFAVVLIRGGTVSGRVVDHEGAPVEGVNVSAHRDRHGRGTRSDGQGDYTISGLEPGDYEIRLTSETTPLPTLTRSATVVAGQETLVNFSIPDPATFNFHTVRVVGTLEDGRPAVGFSLRVSEGWSGSGRDRRAVFPLACFVRGDELTTGADGTLEVLFEEPGVDGVHVYGSPEVDGELYRVKTNACPVVQGEAAVVYVRLPRGEVTLRVRDAVTGRALSGYEYSFETKGHGRRGSHCRLLDGIVRRKVAAGEVTVTVENEGYGRFEQTLLLKDHGQATVEVRLVPE